MAKEEPNHGGRERLRVGFKEGEKERKTKRRKLKQYTRCWPFEQKGTRRLPFVASDQVEWWWD